MADTETKDVPETEEAQESERLNLEVKIDSPSACQRHITVKIPHEDVERYFDQAFGELMPEAQVPGFRAGRAPRKLVEHRFRKEVKDQVKSSLLMDSMAQISRRPKAGRHQRARFGFGRRRSARRRADDVSNSTSKCGPNSICRSGRA